MGQLIQFNLTTNEDGTQAVNARDLHEALESGNDYATWIKKRISYCRLVEGIDYVLYTQPQEKASEPALNGFSLQSQEKYPEQNQGIFDKLVGRGRPKTEYILTVDAAEMVAMVEGTEQGHNVRRMFVDIKKAYIAEIKKGNIAIADVPVPALQQALLNEMSAKLDRLVEKLENPNNIQFSPQVPLSDYTGEITLLKFVTGLGLDIGFAYHTMRQAGLIKRHPVNTTTHIPTEKAKGILRKRQTQFGASAMVLPEGRAALMKLVASSGMLRNRAAS